LIKAKPVAKVKIIYGTSGGNTELVCQKVAEILESEGHEVFLIKAKAAKTEDFQEAELLILASPTYGHGILEQYMDRCLAQVKDLDFTDQFFAAIGLGDMKYDEDYFIESAKILTQFMESRGAKSLLAPLMIARSPIPQLETRVVLWADQLLDHLKS
jgi:flavodoxin